MLDKNLISRQLSLHKNHHPLDSNDRHKISLATKIELLSRFSFGPNKDI